MLAIIAVTRQQDGAGRHPAACLCLNPGDRSVDKLERQLCGAAEKPLDLFRVINAGKLDKDAVRTLALDDRLLGTVGVDPSADDLDRLLKGRCLECRKAGLVIFDAELTALVDNIDKTAELLEYGARLGFITCIAQPYADLGVTDI